MPQGLVSIGLGVLINAAELNYVTEISDIGSAPSEVDVTCLQDAVKKTTSGVRDDKTFEVTYYFDNRDADSDFRRAKAVQETKEPVPVAVMFPDGTAFLSSGYVITYVTGAKIDELIQAKLLVFLQSELVEVETPYELTYSLEDSSGAAILDSTGNPIIGRVVL